MDFRGLGPGGGEELFSKCSGEETIGGYDTSRATVVVGRQMKAVDERGLCSHDSFVGASSFPVTQLLPIPRRS